jgi:hypothetical protein
MIRKAGVRAAAVGVAIVAAMVLSGVAMAGGLAPSLGPPNHKHVNPGRIKMVVSVPQAAAKQGVFIIINRKRKLDANGHLTDSKCNVSHGCFTAEPKHAGGHKWVYIAPADTFNGWFATTAGKYYWQADYFTRGDVAHYYGGIGWFVVK